VMSKKAPPPPPKVKVCGKVKSASDNTPVPGANVQVQGQTLAAVSDILGKFCITEVPQGKVILLASKTGWVDTEKHLPNITGDTDGIIVELSKTIAPKDWRIILTWGKTPLDLDARPKFGNDESCSVMYDNRGPVTCPANGITGTLDLDHCWYGADGKKTCNDASHEGKPETVTLRDVDPDTCGNDCKIVYYVTSFWPNCHQWQGPGYCWQTDCGGGAYCPAADTGTIETSQAHVRVIHGDEEVAEFSVAKGDGKMQWPGIWATTWFVFYIDVKTGVVHPCKDVDGSAYTCS